MNDQSNLPTVIGEDAFLAFVERAMRSPDYDVSKFQVLITEYRMERDRVKRDSFNRSMALVQGEIGTIQATGRNPTFNNPYATLADIDRAARPVLAAHGFSIRFGSALTDRSVPPPANGELRVVLVISHRDGYAEEHFLDGPKDVQTGARGRTGIQAVGSTVSYLRRYLYMMVINLVQAGSPEDDDGEATRHGVPRNPPPRQGNGGAAAMPEWPTRIAGLRQTLGGFTHRSQIDAFKLRSERVIDSAPEPHKSEILKAFAEAEQRVATPEKPAEPATTARPKSDDPVVNVLMDEVDAMDLETAKNLDRNVTWRGKLDMVFPGDLDMLNEHIAHHIEKLEAANG